MIKKDNERKSNEVISLGVTMLIILVILVSTIIGVMHYSDATKTLGVALDSYIEQTINSQEEEAISKNKQEKVSDSGEDIIDTDELVQSFFQIN